MSNKVQCPKCSQVTMWDNRVKKASGEFKPKSPDFSCSNPTCKHAIWPQKKQAPGMTPQMPQYDTPPEEIYRPNTSTAFLKTPHTPVPVSVPQPPPKDKDLVAATLAAALVPKYGIELTDEGRVDQLYKDFITLRNRIA